MTGQRKVQRARRRTVSLRTIGHLASCKCDLGIAWARHGMRVERALFYPERPTRGTVIYQVCHLLGYRISNDLEAPASFAMAWEDRTFREMRPELVQLSDRLAVFNLGCQDISKRRVEAVHKEVFGYGLAIDPRIHAGPYVRKANENSRHDGRVTTDLVDTLEEGVVYQRVVDNRVSRRLVQDIRVLVCGDTIPLCYLKTRPIESRFSNGNSWVSIGAPSELLSAAERRLIVQLCRRLGMDVGEVDALRDRGTGLLYVVDANPTPVGPPNGLPREEGRAALRRVADALAPVLTDAARSRGMPLPLRGEPLPG